jgi:hypothetical protein
LDTALATAKARLLAERNFGKEQESVLIGIKDPDDPHYQGTWAEVTFDPHSTYHSSNNLGGQSQTFGLDGVILDAGSCQLVAVSQYRNKRVVAYEMVTGPPLPFSLGTTGALVAGGTTLIGAVEDTAVLADGLSDDDLIEGGVVANGSSTELPEGVPATLTLKDSVRVVGDAQTTGSAEVAPTVKIERGKVKQVPEKQELPRITIKNYDPADKGDAVVRHDGQANVPATGPLYGYHRYTPAAPGGAVTFTGDVELQGALLYVDGDVVLEKPLKGTGALVATGSVTLKGGADMKADALAAVLAGGDLTVTGAAGAQKTQFTGLLYTEGNFSLSNTRVVGAALANGDGSVGQGSTMRLIDSEVLASPEGQDVAIAIQDFATGGGGGMGGRGDTSSGEVDLIIEPRAADLFVDGGFRTDRPFIESLLKIRYQGVTYDRLADLPPGAPSNLRTEFERTVNRVVNFAKQLQAQHERKPVEIVRFDLNEFLNVSDRLRSSRTFYIEG